MFRHLKYLFIVAVLAVSVHTLAQEEEDVDSTQVWINEYTEGADMLSYAAREVDKGNYKAAIEVYQGLIEKVRKEKEFSSRVVSASEGVYLPLRKRCFQEIMKLPPEGREIYGILYESKAERLYEQAASKQDIPGLLAVVQDFLPTPAGMKACLRLADLSIEQADYALALHYIETLTYYHYKDKDIPTLYDLKRAACLLQSGEKDAAGKIIEKLAGVALEGDDKRICEYLKGACKATGEAKKKVFNSFYDGFVDIDKNPGPEIVALPEKGQPDHLEWRFQLERTTQNKTERRSYNAYSLIADGAMGFDVYPVFYNDLLFVNDSSRLFALAINGGKIKWREPDEDAPKIDGLPLGSYISEGKLFAVLRNTNAYTAVRFTGRGAARQSVQSVNELYCFDAENFGNNPPLWKTSSLRETTTLGQTSFTSIPFVDGSRVYVPGVDVTDQDQNYNVTCFSTDGEFLWQTKFCATKWTGQGNLLRAASMIVTRGKVIVSTNVGVAASMSAFTGELEWVYKYPLSSITDTAGQMVRTAPITWQPTPPIVWYGTHPADGKPCEALVLAPGDSDFILGFDMEARRLLWRWERSSHTYVIGPRGEDIFVYGGASLESSDPVVRQHRIPDGLIRWEAPIPTKAFNGADLVFGKGVATPNALYIPCSKQLIEIVDGKDEKAYYGKVARAATWYAIGDVDKKEDTSSTDPDQERIRRMLAAQGVAYPGQNRQYPDETRLRGNMLLLPDRIITAGCKWINSFRESKEPGK